MPATRLTDEDFDRLLGHVLRFGVLLSAAIVLAGAAVYLVRHAGDVPDYHVFRGEPGELRSVRGIVGDARTLRGRGVIQLGLLFLIATPIARVLFSVAGFLRQRDWMYVVITTIVLVLLLYSLLSA